MPGHHTQNCIQPQLGYEVVSPEKLSELHPAQRQCFLLLQVLLIFVISLCLIFQRRTPSLTMNLLMRMS